MMSARLQVIQNPSSTYLKAGTMVGAGFVVAAIARGYMARERPEERTRTALVAYLRDHLSGADLAVRVVERLRRAPGGAAERRLFDWLYAELERDRGVVRSLLRTFGASTLSAKRLAGQGSGLVLKMLAGGARGDLSLFRTLEALAIGVQGKRCMWRALQSIDPALAVPNGHTLAELEWMAIRQWEAIEERRLALAISTFGRG